MALDIPSNIEELFITETRVNKKLVGKEDLIHNGESNVMFEKKKITRQYGQCRRKN